MFNTLVLKMLKNPYGAIIEVNRPLSGTTTPTQALGNRQRVTWLRLACYKSLKQNQPLKMDMLSRSANMRQKRKLNQKGSLWRVNVGRSQVRFILPMLTPLPSPALFFVERLIFLGARVVQYWTNLSNCLKFRLADPEPRVCGARFGLGFSGYQSIIWVVLG